MALAAAFYLQAYKFVVVAGEGGPSGAAADAEAGFFLVWILADKLRVFFVEAAGPLEFIALADGALDCKVGVFVFVVPANGGGGFGAAAATGGIGGGELYFPPYKYEARCLFGGSNAGWSWLFEVLAVGGVAEIELAVPAS